MLGSCVEFIFKAIRDASTELHHLLYVILIRETEGKFTGYTLITISNGEN